MISNARRWKRIGSWTVALVIGVGGATLSGGMTLMVGCTPAVGSEAAPLTLASPAVAAPVVYVHTGAEETEREAAEELARVLGEMTGRDVGVTALESVDELPAAADGNGSGAAAGDGDADGAESDPGAALVVGGLAEELGLKMDESSRAGDGYRYAVRDGRVLIVGESPEGVRHGTFAFLEHMGAGWYVPGEIGEVIPEREIVEVASDLDHSEVSDSVHRRFWYGGAGSGAAAREAAEVWTSRLGGHNRIGSWSHAWRGLVPPDEHFEQNPELFSYNASTGERTTRQLCTTNPETIRIAAETLMQRMEANPDQIVFQAGPNDGGGLCECEDCLALDDPDYLEPSRGFIDATDRIFRFAEDVAEITSQEYPDRLLGVLIYSDYSRIPRTIDELHPNVRPQFAPIRRCRLHGPGHPECRWNQLWAEEIDGWAAITDQLGFYIYNYNLADTLLPLSKISFYKRLQDQVRTLDIDELDWVFETMDSWSQHAPHHYLSVKLSWRSDIDVDAEMDRFFQGFYGAAAEPMRSYWLRIDDAYERGDTHTGAAYGQHHIWTDELLESSRSNIAEALSLASNERERAAVEMAEAGLGCAELFMEIRRAIKAVDFIAAHDAYERLRDHVHAMAEVQDAPNWADRRYAFDRYYTRFMGRTVEGGYEVLRDGASVIVQMPDVWKFTRDEEVIGADEGFGDADFDDADWGELHTYTKSWDDQGLGWYHGQGWYRVRFDMPEFDNEADLRLWFGGFDENVDVYLNGEHLGERRGFATPAEYEGVEKHLVPGENVLAVRVTNYGLAELGTGGIMMPVMIYEAARTASPEDHEDHTDEEMPAYEM